MVIYLGLGGALQTNITGVCGECSQCLGHTGFAPAHSVYAFPVYTARAPGGCAGELSKAGPELCALPRSKLLRFRSLCTPQRHRLSWVCALCPSQVRAPQATRCLASAFSQVCATSYHLPGPSLSVSWVWSDSAVSGVPCVSSGGLISDCNPPGGCQHPGLQEDLVSNWGPACSLVEDAISGAEIAPCLPTLAAACLPFCLRWVRGQSTAGQVSSGICPVLCSVSRPGSALS